MVTGPRQGTARVWEITSGRLITTLDFSDATRVVAWSPDGARIATAGAPQEVYLWDACTGTRNGGLGTSHQNGILALAWSPDGTRIATAPSLEGVRVWDAASGKLIRALQDPGVEAMDWTPGRNLVASTTGRAIRFWETETWECSAEVPLTGSRTASM